MGREKKRCDVARIEIMMMMMMVVVMMTVVIVQGR
jgi:hypothetical protein